MSFSLHEPASPGLLDRLEELLAETVRSRSESNHTLQLLFEVCNAQRESLAVSDGWVETLSDQVDSCHAKLDGLTDVCKQQFDDLQTKADGLATTLASVSALLANASQRPATRTSGDPLVSAPSLPPLVVASHSSYDPPKPSAPPLPDKHVSVDTVMQSVASVNAPHAVANPVQHPAQLSARDQAHQYLSDHGVLRDAAVATLTTMLSAAFAEKDLGKRMKQADTWAKCLLDDSLKFIVGVTDVGEWLEEARVAAAMLTCLADHMPGIIDHAWVHDRLLALVPSEFHARLKATKSTTRTPQTLFALARQAFQDKHAELTITLAAPTYAASFKQPADRSFEQHLEACVKVYRSHYIREPLTPARYVERFGPTHRLGPLSTVFQTYVRTQLSHMSIDEASHAYLHGALEPIRTVCRMLDREEEERAHMAGVAAQAASLDATPPADFGRGFDPYQGCGGRGGRGSRGGPSSRGGRNGCGGNDLCCCCDRFCPQCA
jgi:hypothetical protein